MSSKTMVFLGAAALFAGAVNGHMIMAQPAPFGKPDNSPLSASGSDFPCKLGQVNNFQGTTINMPSGQSQPLTFTGSAVHGGGSCQISLTKDSAPTKSSSFKVIHSFLGACPGINGPSAFNFTMPSEVPNNKYVLAWTWFNNIGNREMYMNCAPVAVTGSSGSDSTFSSLPDMAVYNLADINSCKTVETFDVQFPNPGKYVTTASTFKAKAPAGTNCGGSSNATSGTGSSGASGASSAAGSASTAASGSSGSFGEGASGGSGTTAANNGQYTGVGAASSADSGSSVTATSLLTVYSTQTASGSAATAVAGSGTSGASNGTSGAGSLGSDSGSAASAASGGSAATTSAAGSASTSPAASGSSGSTGSSSGSTSGASCSPDGSVVCSADGTSYGLCNFGSAIMMPVAAGTKCSNGQIMRRADFKA